MHGLELEAWAATQGPAQSGVEREGSARHVSLLHRILYDRAARIHVIATSLRPDPGSTTGVVARPSGGA
jgi:hypothetical protein